MRNNRRRVESVAQEIYSRDCMDGESSWNYSKDFFDAWMRCGLRVLCWNDLDSNDSFPIELEEGAKFMQNKGRQSRSVKY